MKILSVIFHIIFIILLTLLTQVGGIIWIIIIIAHSRFKRYAKLKHKVISFLALYTFSTLLIIPYLALPFGRTSLPMSKKGNLAPHNYFTIILNRQYVKPQLKSELIQISNNFAANNKGLKTIYLDANFPFWDGFPLLPHLSHDDGKKVDLSFIYSKEGSYTNQKPSRSGYGYYERPTGTESDQPKICASKGYWQYSFPQYLTLGSTNKLKFEASKTEEILDLILRRPKTHKVFIEPHLKERMRINHKKLRYHGCKAVRHDDHIHYQIN